MKAAGNRVQRCNTPLDAVNRAAPGSGVLFLADHYPARRTQVDDAVWSLAAARQLRVFVEFPDAVPGLALGESARAEWELVVASDRLGAVLPRHKILAAHSCSFVRASSPQEPLLVIARVAGFDTAVFGIPTNAAPLLFEIPDRRIVVATTKLSDFVRGRYAPARDWETVWKSILARIDPGGAPHVLRWSPAVQPAWGPEEKLPKNVERIAIRRAAEWIRGSGLLVSPDRTNAIVAALRSGQETAAPAFGEGPGADGRLGILEGFESAVQPDGTQRLRLPLRADCNAESAMVLAAHGCFFGGRGDRRIASNLLDYVYFGSGLCGGVRADPAHGAFGLIGWGDIAPVWEVANYGDDNARTLQATILAAACLKTDRWNDAIAKALLANLRTTGRLGFRGDRIDNPQLAAGWKNFWNAETVNYAPHFESGLWACYLWAYRQSGYRPFLDRTKTAIRMTMEVYPDGWRFKDQMERARMLLCLAWLVRVEDTPQHRAWLKRIASDMLQHQQPNGAVREWLGGIGGGHYQIPQSNEAYGTGETPLIQQNGDPATDQLYGTGFALFGLHEAAAATGDLELAAAADRLAEFLCRIQVKSERFPFVDGWWFRAFDDRAWEYWASSADAGWGAWSLEAGWGQAWTAATLALRQERLNFWDFTESVRLAPAVEHWRRTFLSQ